MDETVQEFYEKARHPHISSRAREEQRDELSLVNFSVYAECANRAEQVTEQRALSRCSCKH